MSPNAGGGGRVAGFCFTKERVAHCTKYPTQCCQLFAELLGQSRRKIRSTRKKIRPPVIFPFWRNFGLKENTIFVCVSGKVTIFLGHLPIIREEKRRETILLKFGPFLLEIGQNSATELSGRSTFYSAIFFTYATEQSASWQHCPHK